MNLIIDTNIFLDYAFERKNYKFAQKLFIDTISCKHKIFLPNIIIEELKIKKSYFKFEKGFFNDLTKKNKLIIIKDTYEIVKESKEIALTRNLPFADVLIAKIAKQNNCIIVTRDKHLFLDLFDLVDSFKPEELI
jgi:predicted nucleic acid-binding protein